MLSGKNYSTKYVQLNQILSQFYQRFYDRFFKKCGVYQPGNPFIPEGTYEEAFRLLWKAMSSSNREVSILDSFFDRLRVDTTLVKNVYPEPDDNFLSPVENYFVTQQLPESCLVASGLIPVYVQIILIYHYFARLKLLFVNLAAYQKNIAKLKKETEVIENQLFQVNRIGHLFTHGLHERGFSSERWDVPTVFINRASDKKKEALIKSIHAKLVRVPTVEKIQKLLKTAMKQNGISDDGKTEALARKKFLSQVAEEVRQLPDKILTFDQTGVEHPQSESQLDPILIEMELEVDGVIDLYDGQEGAEDLVLVIHRELWEMNTFTTQMFQTMQALGKMCRDRSDDHSASMITDWAQVICKEMRVISEEYMKPFATKDDCSRYWIRQLRNVYKYKEEKKAQLIASVDKSKKSFEKGAESITRIANTCDVISKIAPIETVFSILKKHWGKILLGGVLIGGVGALIAVYCLPFLLLTVIGLSLAGLIIGGCLGLLLGIAIDYKSKFSLPKLTDEEVDRLVNNSDCDTIFSQSKVLLAMENNHSTEPEKMKAVVTMPIAKKSSHPFSFKKLISDFIGFFCDDYTSHLPTKKQMSYVRRGSAQK